MSVSLNKLALNEMNEQAARYVQYTVGNENAFRDLLDQICTPYYDVNAPYFIQHDEKTGETLEINTINLAHMRQNFDLLDQLDEMGMIQGTPALSQQP